MSSRDDRSPMWATVEKAVDAGWGATARLVLILLAHRGVQIAITFAASGLGIQFLRGVLSQP